MRRAVGVFGQVLQRQGVFDGHGTGMDRKDRDVIVRQFIEGKPDLDDVAVGV